MFTCPPPEDVHPLAHFHSSVSKWSSSEVSDESSSAALPSAGCFYAFRGVVVALCRYHPAVSVHARVSLVTLVAWTSSRLSHDHYMQVSALLSTAVCDTFMLNVNISFCTMCGLHVAVVPCSSRVVCTRRHIPKLQEGDHPRYHPIQRYVASSSYVHPHIKSGPERRRSRTN